MKNILAILLSFIITIFPFLGVNNKPANPELNITKEEAKAIILDHAGLKESEIARYRIELDNERGKAVYEVEFDSGKFEYDYEINADTGEVLKSEKEFRD